MLARLGNIPLEVRVPMLGTVAGRHKSPNRGSSVEFAEYRKYVQGDDTRRLDWKAYARSDRYYIKEFEADTNLRAYFVIDSSGSMNFQSGDNPPKIDIAQKIAASLAYPAHLQYIFKTLNDLKPKGETGLVEALHEIAEKVPQRALIVILSDFFCDVEELEKAMAHLQHRKHDVAVFHLMDRQEIDFEFQRPHRFVDLEDGSTVVAEPQIIEEEYRAAIQEFLGQVRTASYDINADYHLVTTDLNLEDFLRDFLVSRLPKGK